MVGSVFILSSEIFHFLECCRICSHYDCVHEIDLVFVHRKVPGVFFGVDGAETFIVGNFHARGAADMIALKEIGIEGILCPMGHKIIRIAHQYKGCLICHMERLGLPIVVIAVFGKIMGMNHECGWISTFHLLVCSEHEAVVCGIPMSQRME